MAESGGSEWIVEPAAPGTIHFQVSVGEGTEVTAEQVEALKELVDSLAGREVEGYGPGKPGPCGRPGLTECHLTNCVPVLSGPCFTLISCRVGP